MNSTYPFISPALCSDIGKTYAWNNLGFSLFTPFCNFGVDLIPKLWLDLPSIAWINQLWTSE